MIFCATASKSIVPSVAVILTASLLKSCICPGKGPATFVSTLKSPCCVYGVTGGIISQYGPGAGGIGTPGVFGASVCCNAL